MTSVCRFGSLVLVLIALSLPFFSRAALPSVATSGAKTAAKLQAGFGETDITPKLGKRPVYMAGFGRNRKAKAIHDPLKARALVLKAGAKKIALVSVDLVGLFLEPVERVRQKLPQYDYVLVSSTHNHEGPDTLGLWGPHPLQSGVDPSYLKFVEKQIVAAVRQAERSLQNVRARIGTTKAPELLADGRLPIVKHDELVTLAFYGKGAKKPAGIVVQWNCHPETLSSRNKAISADFVGPAVAYLKKKYACPVVYFTGTVGGLMTTLHLPVQDKKGQPLRDGTWEKTQKYGELVGQRVEKALTGARSIQLTPIKVRSQRIFLPIDNKLYVLGWQTGVLKRKAYYWQNSSRKAKPIQGDLVPKHRVCVQTEVGLIALGQLQIAAIPGEIYPELVLGKVEDPAQKGADFPKAPVEPSLYKQMRGPYRMVIGLANDEIGYILPKRQWDAKAPFCYGRKKAQYGETNSLGPETGPLLCEAFRELIGGKRE